MVFVIRRSYGTQPTLERPLYPEKPCDCQGNIEYLEVKGEEMTYLEFVGEDKSSGVAESSKFWQVTQEGKK